jgi:hypothetical protein
MQEIRYMRKSNDLYDECKDCETLDHCPHSDVERNGFSTPMPPDGCPKPVTIMRNTLKKKKLINSKYELS